MKNFKEIAEKCLSGELSGTFVTAFGNNWHSNYLRRHAILGHEMPAQYVLGPGVIYNEIGQCESREKIRIIDFIPDNMQKQIKIDIPEGKEVVQKIVDGEIRIKFVDKKLDYGDIVSNLLKSDSDVVYEFWSDKISEGASKPFYKKVEVLRKLTNIRNYFGKPDSDGMGYYISSPYSTFKPYIDKAVAVSSEVVVFAKKEHAEQAIKILGNELKYLFEPW